MTIAGWLAVAGAVGGDPTDALWAYLGSSLPAGAVLNGFGLGVLTFLFARDLILTRGQHQRRVADIEKAHGLEVEALKAGHVEAMGAAVRSHASEVANLREYHQAIVAEKDRAYAELETSRNYYRQARTTEAEARQKVTDQLAESVEVGRLALDLLRGIDKAAGNPNGSN